VKPPPRVTPHIQEPSPPAPVSSSYESSQRSDSRYPEDPDFEALVQQEMARIQSQLEEIPQLDRYDAPRNNYPIDHSIQKYQSPVRNADGYPREMYDERQSSSGPAAADYYPGLFDRHDHSLSPRRVKGRLNDLYGPDDDRQNMKAAKAAAYSHQVSFPSALCGHCSSLIVGASKKSTTPLSRPACQWRLQ
jgi:hypothetical protein